MLQTNIGQCKYISEYTLKKTLNDDDNSFRLKIKLQAKILRYVLFGCGLKITQSLRCLLFCS